MDKDINITELPFIRTTDAETAELLKRGALELIAERNGVWTFLNCTNKSINFDNKKISFTNKLYF